MLRAVVKENLQPRPGREIRRRRSGPASPRRQNDPAPSATGQVRGEEAAARVLGCVAGFALGRAFRRDRSRWVARTTRCPCA